MPLPNVSEISWKEALPIISKADPVLAEIIDALKPKYKHSMILARYPFGSEILQEGRFFLPTNSGKVSPLNSNDIDKKYKEKLDYQFVPMGLIIDKSVEVFFETDTRIMPSKLFTAGEIFGLWQLLDPEPKSYVKKLWNLSAGARSIMMLPNISDATHHARLRRNLKIKSYPPKNLIDHRNLFKELACQADSKEKWACSVLYFTKDWVTNDSTDYDVMRLQNHWLSEAWKQSFNCRDQMSYSVAQEAFSKMISRRNIKPKPYILNTINHLIAISKGIFPGFVAAGNQEIAAPVKLIQDIYINDYLLKNYSPIIMRPHHLTNKSSYNSVYYSLSFPTLLEFTPKTRNSPYIMADMRELKSLMEIMEVFLEESSTEFNFFHNEKDQYNEINHSEIMPTLDSYLNNYPSEYGKKVFPHNSAFLRGCVQIKLKKKH